MPPSAVLPHRGKTMRKWISRGFGFVACALIVPLHAQGVAVADLARHLQFSDVRISPDGKYLAMTSLIKDQPALTLLDLATGKGHNVLPRDGDQVVDFWWVNDDRVLYTVGTKVSGFDRPASTGEIFGVNADGSGAKLLFGYRAGWGEAREGALTHHGPEAERASAELIDTLRDDPNHVLIGVEGWDNGAEGAYTQVYRMDVRDGTKSKLTTAPLRNAGFVADHHGVVRFAYGVDGHAHGKVYYRANDGAPWTLLFSESSEHGLPMPQAFSHDDSQVYMTCMAPDAIGALCQWDVAKQAMGAPVWTNPRVDPAGLIWSLDRRDVVGVEAMDGLPAISALTSDADTIDLIAAISPSFPGQAVQVVSSTDDGGKAVVLVSSAEDPGTYYLWNAATKKLSQLLARASWIKPNQMAAMRPVDFKARDGLMLHGYLSMPPGKEDAKQLPLVVFVHGGPIGIRDYWDYDPYVQMMATHGYAVLQVNYRGSGGYGYGFEHAGYREWGGKMQDDVTDATQWAIAQGITSPGHICIFGGSYGGYAALEGAVKEPDLYRCAIGYVGVYDLALMYKRGDIPQSSQGESYLHEALGDDQAVLAAHSPITQLDKLKAQVMLIVGGADQRVPSVQGMNMHMAMMSRHIPHEWLYEADEGHGYYTEAHVAELYARVLAFLDRNLGNGTSVAATH